MDFAEQVGDKRNLAEAQLVLSRSLPPDAHEERLALAQSASELLTATEADLRGRAEAELGRVLAEADQHALAHLYLESGWPSRKPCSARSTPPSI